MERKDLLNSHGRRFKAIIDGIPCEGKVSVEGEDVYLCHDDEDLEGELANDMMGYPYSWKFDSRVKDFRFIELDPSTYKDWQVGDKVCREIDPKEIVGEVIFRSGKLVVLEWISSGCASSNLTCDELFNEEYRLYVEPEVQKSEPVEITIEEIATKFGIKPEQVRVKKKE